MKMVNSIVHPEDMKNKREDRMETIFPVGRPDGVTFALLLYFQWMPSIQDFAWVLNNAYFMQEKHLHLL